MKNCKNCRKEFQPKHKRQVFCLPVCSKKYHRTTEKAKASAKAYEKSERRRILKNKSARIRYNSEDGKDKHKEKVRKYQGSEKGQATQKAYRQSEKGKALRLAARIKWIERYPEKVLAQLLASQLKRKECVVEGCGEMGHRHHPDYSNPLEIVFLCHKHHMQLHAGMLVIDDY